MKLQPLALKAVIPSTGNPIAFAGGEGEDGTLRLSFFEATGEDITRLLALRGKELHVVLVEAEH